MTLLKYFIVVPVIVAGYSSVALGVPDPHFPLYPNSKNVDEIYQNLAKVALENDTHWIQKMKQARVPVTETAWIDYDGGRPCSDCH